MSKVSMTADENIQKVAEKINHEGLSIHETSIVRTMEPAGTRFPHPSTPLVKVQLRDLNAKRWVLQSKLKLANTQAY